MHNAFGSIKGGYDYRLFEFLADRIARSVELAYERKAPAFLESASTSMMMFARNRSYPAFRLDPERARILKENASLPIGPIDQVFPFGEAYRAIDPKLTLLRIRNARDRTVLGCAVFLAVHPTVMDSRTEVYSSDVFGVAAQLAGRRIAQDDPSASPIVDFFNGAEGDVAPVCATRDRKALLKLSAALADSIFHLSHSCSEVKVDSIQMRFRFAQMVGRCFDVDGPLDCNGSSTTTQRCTDQIPVPGDPMLGGAEDGRTQLNDLGWKEGIKGLRDSPQSPKEMAFHSTFLPKPLPWLIDQLRPRYEAPQLAPLGVYRIGSLMFVALPGEFSTVMGRRIRESLLNSARGIDQVILLGLSNEYVSYFTTPEEYESQQYEGASMLYGAASGILLEKELKEMTELLGKRFVGLSYEQRYLPGRRESFGIDNVGVEPWNPDDGLENIVQDTTTGDPIRNEPTVVWRTKSLVSKADRWGGFDYPKVWVQEKESRSDWHDLNPGGTLESNEGLDFVTEVLAVKGDTLTWACIWIVPAGLNLSSDFRFKIKETEGNSFVSRAFHVPQGRDDEPYNRVSPCPQEPGGQPH